MEFYKKSYHIHANKGINSEKYKTWQDEETVDFWRHERMYNLILPLLKYYPNSSWLTIGDGRFGTDAHFIAKFTKNVLATDINDKHLKIALKEGYIRNYKVENAEKLSFPDAAFDFVLCKESYHHFPRPSIALYEMLRVTKKAVILIEPTDHNIRVNNDSLFFSFFNLWQSFKNSIKRIMGKGIYYNYGNYEPSGNYVYTISRRELEKVALGINLPLMIIKGLNDFYIDGAEFEKYSENGPIFKAINTQIKRLNRRSKKGILYPNILTCILFKENIPFDLITEFEKEKYNIIHLPRNPYLT